MQRHGHRPIALVGGGTGLVGDPSGKTEMRRLLTPELVTENADGIKSQLARFIDFADDQGPDAQQCRLAYQTGIYSFPAGHRTPLFRQPDAES